MSFRDKMVSTLQIVSRNNDRVNLHSVVLHPYSFLQFKSLQEDCCARVLHPEHDVEVFCQVSSLSGQRWALVIQRLGYKSCDYVRTTSKQHNPKSYGGEKEWRRESRLLLQCNKQSQDWSSDATPGYIY